jgi:DNA-binding MarR family transcriptional regulator
MTSVNTFLQQGHVPYLLDRAHRRMQQDLAALVDARAFPELRGSHFRLLGMIPAEGARPSTLADIAQVTRPALGEFLRHLEAHGYIETDADVTDGRAVIVRLSARGERAAAVADQAVAELRRRWTSAIGAERLEALVDALVALTGDS